MSWLIFKILLYSIFIFTCPYGKLLSQLKNQGKKVLFWATLTSSSSELWKFSRWEPREWRFHVTLSTSFLHLWPTNPCKCIFLRFFLINEKRKEKPLHLWIIFHKMMNFLKKRSHIDMALLKFEPRNSVAFSSIVRYRLMIIRQWEYGNEGRKPPLAPLSLSLVSEDEDVSTISVWGSVLWSNNKSNVKLQTSL